MSITLSSVKASVTQHLSDSSGLIWSALLVEEAIHAALIDLSRVYGTAQTLKDLDAATETTFDKQDLYVLIQGALAYALVFRVVRRFEESTPEPKLTPAFGLYAQEAMQEFRAQLTDTRHRLHQTSANPAWLIWPWPEKGGF